MTVLYQKNPSPELAHMCWCLLVAVKMARRVGKIASDLQEHLFIMQWLANARKRHLFPKIVANDIAWFIPQGKKYGYGAKLYNKVEYIYRSRSGALVEKSALFRFTYFVETLKTMGWLDYLLSPQNGRITDKPLQRPVRSIRQKLCYMLRLMRRGSLLNLCLCVLLAI